MATQVAAPAPTGLQRRFKGCSKIGEYELLKKLGEGTFGEVHQARHVRSARILAMKKILTHNEKDGFPITALREIKLLKMLSHDNVLKLEEMSVERPKAEGRKRAILYMVMPYMDHDLSGLLDNPDVKFSEPQVKCYMLQLFKGLRYLHHNHILHRDMKAANLLINNRGRLQIADFGLARHYDEPVPQRGKGNGEAKRDYTTLVVTRWYRPPELLLQLRRYTPAIDMWGAGCVFGEMFKRKPILAGQSDLHQAQIIFELVGSPNDRTMPGWNQLPGAEPVKSFTPSTPTLTRRFTELSAQGLDLLSKLLMLDWRKRINAIDAIDHPYFTEDPQPMREEDIPTFADSHELDRRNARGQKQHLPPAPAGGTVGGGPNGEWTGSGPPQSGPGWGNGDRRYGPPDRGPPGVDRPRGNHDRRPPAYDHRQQPPGERRPHWGGNGAAIPQAPPAHAPRYGAAGDRGHRDRAPPGDTYIPSYGNEGARPREPDDRPRDGRRGSRDSPHSRDGVPDDRSDRGRGFRDRTGDSRNFGRDRRDGRTRSRSPDRRDRARERDRDVYRR